MQSYLKSIAALNNNDPAITSLAVWISLCKIFYTQLNPHAFHQPLNQYSGLVRTFSTCKPEQLAETDFFQQIINNFFSNLPLDTTNEVIVMLRAYLICYPEHLIGLHVSIVNVLNVRPYHLPILISDLYAWNVDFEDPSGYKQNNSFLIHCADRFSTIHLTHFLTGLNDRPFIKKSKKKILAAKLLGILWKRAPDIDFAIIGPLTLEALGTMRHSHYGSGGSECEGSECEDYAPVFVAQHLVKILNHSSLDITPLLDYIAIDFSNKKAADKQAGLRLLARLIRNATTHHASILQLLRTLVSGADNLTKCSLISMICRISNEAAELTQHVPLLLICSRREEEYEENLLATRATKAFQSVKDKLLVLAGRSPENSQLIISKLISFIPEMSFIHICEILQLLAKTAANIHGLEDGLTWVLEMLHSDTLLEVCKAIETMAIVCQKLTHNIPEVLSALTLAITSSTHGVREKAYEALMELIMNTDADYTSTVPFLLNYMDNDLIGDKALNVLGQVLISSHPPVAMTAILPSITVAITKNTDYFEQQYYIEFIGEIAIHRTADYTEVFNAIFAKIPERTPEDDALNRRIYSYKEHITALGNMSAQVTVDMKPVIKLLLNRLKIPDGEANDSIKIAILKISDSNGNMDLVVTALLNKLRQVDWIWASYLVSILNGIPDYVISFNFNKFLQNAEHSLLNKTDQTKNAFELLQILSNRDEVNIKTIINILIAATQSSDESIRLTALKMLRTIKGPLDEKLHLTILKTFKHALNHDDSRMSSAAMKGLTQSKLNFLATKPIANQQNQNADLKSELKNENGNNLIHDAKDESAMQINIIRKNKRKFSDVIPDPDISLTRTYKRFTSPNSRRRYKSSFTCKSWDKKLNSPIYKRIKSLHPASNEGKSTQSSVFQTVEVARQTILKEVLTNSNHHLRRLALNHFKEDSLWVGSAKLYHINCLINELQNSNRGFGSEYECCLELTETAKKDSTYANLVIEIFAEETIKKGKDYFIGTEKIFEIISEANLNKQQINHVVYGILLHKLQNSRDRTARFKLIILIDKICRFREMDYHIGIHLKETAVVSLVRHYVGKD